MQYAYLISALALLCLCLASGAASAEGDGYVALCAVGKNENRFVREWVEYHKCLGFSRIFLYDHESKVRMSSQLKEHIDTGFVSYTYFEGHHQKFTSGYSSAFSRFKLTAQGYAYQLCVQAARAANHTFLGFIDIDEYLVLSPKIASVSELLRPYEGKGGLAVHWRLIGSSGHKQRPSEEGGVVDSYTSCFPANHKQHRQFKSFVVLRHGPRMKSPHRVDFLTPQQPQPQQQQADDSHRHHHRRHLLAAEARNAAGSASQGNQHGLMQPAGVLALSPAGSLAAVEAAAGSGPGMEAAVQAETMHAGELRHVPQAAGGDELAGGQQRQQHDAHSSREGTGSSGNSSNQSNRSGHQDHKVAESTVHGVDADDSRRRRRRRGGAVHTGSSSEPGSSSGAGMPAGRRDDGNVGEDDAGDSEEYDEYREVIHGWASDPDRIQHDLHRGSRHPMAVGGTGDAGAAVVPSDLPSLIEGSTGAGRSSSADRQRHRSRSRSSRRLSSSVGSRSLQAGSSSSGGSGSGVSVYLVDENFKRIKDGFVNLPTHRKATVFHYVTKSLQDYTDKLKRGGGAGVTRKMDYFTYVQDTATDTCTQVQETRVRLCGK